MRRATIMALAFSLGIASVAHAKGGGSVRVGDVGLSWSNHYGLAISYRGEAIATKGSATFHDGRWRTIYFALTSSLKDVVVEPAERGKSLRVVTSPPEDLLAVEYVATVHEDGTVQIMLEFELKRDAPMSVEYCALQMSAVPILGCPFRTTTGAKTESGTVPMACAGPNAMLAQKAEEFVVESRLGTISLRAEGAKPWLDVLDGRKRSWADAQNPVFWIGALSQKLEPRVKQRLSLTLRVTGGPTAPAKEFKTAGQPAAPIAAPEVLSAAQVVAPPLIPAPKKMTEGPGEFGISSATAIVIGEKAQVEDRRAADALQRELEEGFGIKAAIQTSANVKEWKGAVVLGEPGLNPLSKSACEALGLAVAETDPGPEGYVLSATPAGIVVAGYDRRGTYWGVQTLLQLLRSDGKGGALVKEVGIRDWPDFAMRAAHWGVRGKETGFQRRMIEKVLARHKINTLFMECESIRWDSHPEWSPDGISPKEVADLVRYANEHFIEVIPQIQSLGHCEYWVLKAHPELAENPDAPYNYCPSNPDTYKLLFDLYREAEATFHPRYFHVGHDELNADFGICPRCKGRSPAQLFADEVRKLRDYWAERNVPILMWSDMLLAPTDAPGGRDAYNGGPPLNIAEALDQIPKDVIIADWHYGGGYEDFPSLDLFKSKGLRTVATPWHDLRNIWNFTRAAKKGGSMGVIGSTWCGVDGPEFDPDSLVNSFKYLSSLVYTADCTWNVGQRPPDSLPYDPQERFLATVNRPPDPAMMKARAGLLVDISPYCTRSLSDKPGAPGWLGYGPSCDLSGFPTGRVRLGRTEFLVPAGERNAIMLWGTFAGKAELPKEVTGIPVGQLAAGLAFLHVCGWGARPAQKVGVYRVHYEDGATVEIPLVYGRNIAEATYPLLPTSARVAWEGKTADGAPLRAYVCEWANPSSEKRISSIDFVSAGTRAAPTLIGLSVISP